MEALWAPSEGLARVSCHSLCEDRDTALKSQKAVSAYFTSEQILPFGFAEQNSRHLDL